MSIRPPKEAPGVTRLQRDRARQRGNPGVRAALQPPTEMFLTPEQEHALFVELKRQGKLRAKQGFGDVRPFLEGYKAALREVGRA